MVLFTVDEKKCRRDGLCAAECPTKIIAQKGDNIPRPVKIADQLCINCGHCVAVCPHGALSLAKMPIESCPPINKELILGSDQAEQFLRSRRSIRTYKDKQVDRETLTRLIEIARYAPTGHNFQPVNWTVIYEKKELDRLVQIIIDWMRDSIKNQPAFAKMMRFSGIVAAWDLGINIVSRGAPHLIITHAPKEHPAGQNSCTNAIAYMELMAGSLGLGTCCCGFFDAAMTFWKPLQEAVQLPDGHHCFGSVMAGYPKYKYHRMVERNEPPINWRV